jgi:hypothetical protein
MEDTLNRQWAASDDDNEGTMTLATRVENTPDDSTPDRHHDDAVEVFQDGQLLNDLERLRRRGGFLPRYIERLRIQSERTAQRRTLHEWTKLYEAGERLIAARMSLEHRRVEYLELAQERELRAAERVAGVARCRADLEEQELRRERAAFERTQVGVTQPIPPEINQDELELNQAITRRQLDERWALHESLRSLRTLIELQHWRTQQRRLVLQDRSLSPDEQSEDLEFVDDLYRQKNAELRVDTRIMEE